jgi:NAD+ synthase (glutamine-hydrolysing)
MKILAAQINPIIGDLKGNTQKIIAAIQRGKTQQVDVVLFPEMVLCGYPPEDFLLLPHFLDAIQAHLQEIIEATTGIAAIVGLPRYASHSTQAILYNSAAILENGKLVDYADKILLPTYDVFDERRYFEPGEEVKVWSFKGGKIAVTICEDIWQHSGILQTTYYQRDPVLELKKKNPTLLLNLSASPYSLDKFETRLNVCKRASQTLGCPLILCNQVGGNDSLIFDGCSLWVQSDQLMQQAQSFKTDDLLVDLSQIQAAPLIKRDAIADLYQALVLGIHDYFKKLNFTQACLGLSGGIDSAVVACLAAAALGPQNVWGIGMPSRYSASESQRDALQIAKNLGMHYQEIPIENPFESYLSLLEPVFKDRSNDITEENLQSRIRGMLLMALSNKFGYLVLSTGNKSEWAMGYSTLYGDMCGGLSVLGDITKQQVYALAQWINRTQEIIPWYTIERPPSAELRPNQKDSDSLPDYAIIDQVLKAYIEEHQSPEQIATKLDYSLSFVQNLIRRIHQNEFKRRQAPLSLRVSEKSFSIGRRFPIVQQWI